MNLVLSVVVAYLFGTFAAGVNAIPVSPPPSSLGARAYVGPLPSTGTSSSSPGSHRERCNRRTFVTYHPGHYYGEYASHPSHFPIHPWEEFGYDKREIWYAIWNDSVQTRDEYKGKVEQMITMGQAHLAAGNQGARRARGLEQLLDCFNLEDTSNADTAQWRSWQNLDTNLFIQWANAEISRVGKIILSAPDHHPPPIFLSPAIAVYKGLKTDREAALRRDSGPVSPHDMTVEHEADCHMSRWEAALGWH